MPRLNVWAQDKIERVMQQSMPITNYINLSVKKTRMPIQVEVYQLLIVAIILIFGYLAEFMFKKFNIPDMLFLIVLGFILGPVLKYITPEQVAPFAPFFTAFALLFLLFDGAFNIDLASFAKGLSSGLLVTITNYLISSTVISLILIIFSPIIEQYTPIRFTIATAILTGFMLSGISSSFVIPVLRQMNIKGEIYSILTLESALTDVLSIVAALTTMEIIKLSSFNSQIVASNIASLFAVAGFIGIIAGIIWIIIVTKVLRHNKSYMVTIAYLIIVYVITTLVGGNGAIAALFFGLVLKNSRQLTSIAGNIVHKKSEKKSEEKDYGVSVTSPVEQLFYSQIAFFLKTFFFVYIGVLISPTNLIAWIIGFVLAFSVMLSRMFSRIILKGFKEFEKKLATSIFAQGLASAAIAQLLIAQKIPGTEFIPPIVYTFITFTIILSSIKIFMLKRTMAVQE